MYIPFDNETVKYLMYSNSKEIDVLYDNESFYLTFDDMLVLFKCSREVLNDAFDQLYENELIQNDDINMFENSEGEYYFSYLTTLLIGGLINNSEANRYSNWVETTLKKYREQQSEIDLVYIHDIKRDFSDEVEMYHDMDPEEGIQMDDLTNYLKRISSNYFHFIDKLIEIENKNTIAYADVEYLDSIDLCFVDRVLDESTFSEFGKDIEKTIYVASLNEVITYLYQYLGESSELWPDKINSLKVKVIQMNVEYKQMFYLLKRFIYYVESLARTYENVVNPSYIAHFEPEFNFWDLCADTYDASDLNAKRVLFVDAKIKATKWLIEESSENDLKKSCEDYIERCQQSIDLIDYEISQKNNAVEPLKTNISTKSEESNTIKLASKKKTEFIKLLSAMYDGNTFESVNPATLLTKEFVLDAFGVFLNEDLQSSIEIENALRQTKTENTSRKSIERQKVFPDYLLHEDKLKLAAAIKEEFSTEKGKAIRIILGAMEAYNPPLISIGNRQGKEIYNSLALFFNKDIGTYQIVFGYIINQKTDKADIDSVTVRLNHLLKMIEKDKIA